MALVFSMYRPRSPYFKVGGKCPTAANKNECLFHRPIALTLRVSVYMYLSQSELCTCTHIFERHAVQPQIIKQHSDCAAQKSQI